jgi:hypothetical protein
MKNNAYQIIPIPRPVNTIKRIILFLIISGTSSIASAQNHLLLSEIALQPAEAEFIELFNPTNSAISLENYYLADNQTYPIVPGNLPAVDMGDFIVQFPKEASINPNKTVVVAINGSYFEGYYGKKADFEIEDKDAGTANMIVTDMNSPTLANAGEGIALFYWNGSATVVKDVDLMNAGVPTETSQIVDKSGIAGYLPDAHTIPVQGHNGPPTNNLSTKRIALEGQNEIHSGGNGIMGDDETSENISKTWDDVFSDPNPGKTDLTVTGIETQTLQENNLKIFPNPTSGEVNLIFNKYPDEFKLEVINPLGTVLRTITHVTLKGKTMKIDLAEFGNGIYFIRVQSDHETSLQKVMLYKIY